MKYLLSILAFFSLAEKIAAQQGTIKITGTRLAYPLFQQWIDAYTKTHTGINFVLTSGIAADSADIVIASYAVPPTEIKPGKQLFAVGRYVQLPIVNSGRKDLSTLQQKGFTEQDFKRIYFNDEQNDVAGKSNESFTVYTRDKPVCAGKAFAGHFGDSVNNIDGIGVAGDDRALLDVVKRHQDAISYNNLGFIYDLKSRKVNDSIAIVPIDINENGKIDEAEKIYNTLDEVVAFAQRTNNSKLPAENVNVIVNKSNAVAAKEFLVWILKQGQQYNHAFGFLKVSESVLEDELAILAVADEAFDLDAMYGKQN